MNKINTQIYSIFNFSNVYMAIFFKIISSLAFALVNGLVRYVSGGAKNTSDSLSFYEIAFLQNLIGALILLPSSLNKQTLISFNKKNIPFYVGYILFAAIGLILWYASLYYLPIAIAVSLGFLSPLFTALFCKIFLKENLGLIRSLAIFIGMVGAFFITRPDQILFDKDLQFDLYIFLPMLSTISFVASKLFSRVLALRGESPKTMTLFLLIFMTPISLIPALGTFSVPNETQMICIIAIAFLAALAHVLMARSFALAEISYLTPFGFIRLIASGIIGYVAFSEMPQGFHTWTGMAIIFFSLILLSFEQKK